jgi:hypothetical protein
VTAPEGTDVTILLSVQLFGVARMPLKLTALLPWVAPKLEPLTVTKAATEAKEGETLLILGPVAKLKLIVVVVPAATDWPFWICVPYPAAEALTS